MSTAQHTPGPWIVGDDEDSDFFLVGPEMYPGLVGCPVVRLHNQANARLIAEAPELLAALQPFVTHNSSDETITITVRTADVTRARAAIAKASGSAA